jgi:SAM-dependent methyltransferase
MTDARESGDAAPAGSTYAFDNASRHAPARFDALSSIFDEGTIRHLEARGVAEGWSCLEVGGGGGSIAAWLHDRVGPTGRVLATDLDTRFLETLDLPRLEVRRHDVVSDPLPEAAFDLVHTRLVLVHLPERDRALARLVAALKPGGWVLCEEFDGISMLPDPAVNPREVALEAAAATRRVVAERGVEPRYGRLLPGELERHGLVDLGAEGRVFMWRGGSAGARLLRANFEQLRDEIVGTGLLSEEELERDIARLDDPSFAAPSPVLWAAWGRRPLAP